MDVESLAKQLILQNMTSEQQTAVLDSIRASVMQAKDVQKQRIGENVQVVVQALKKLEADIKARYDETGKAIEKRVASIKDGQDGRNGTDGKAGKDGRPGRDGAVGPKGADGLNGRDGIDGENGVSVTDAHIDFDGSLIITLSSGRTINVGEVVAPDLAEKIKVITNGGGTSQTVIDALASLQTQIDNLIPDQTGNAGKFLTTDGSVLSWSSVAGGLSYQGTWNATTNTPTLASGTGVNGYYYITATAGSTNLDGITDWQVGDWLMFNGSVWQKIDQSNLVTSVNGQTGAVSLSTTNISEGTNLYYTDARARASVSAGTGISYSSATGVITNAAPDQTVALTAGTGISTTGTYPNFTIANTAPDQTVALTQGGTTTITGTYPNFTISSADQYAGTVTSVSGTGTVNGISLSGTVTSSGSLTLGGTLSNVSLATQVTGTLPVANGGTGVTSSTGTGSVVLSSSPTLVTPALGTPSALVGTNITGTAAGLSIGGNAATATTATNQSGGTVSATSIAYSTTLTGGTGVVNIGSGQVYKDASGNVGLATSSPRVRLDVRSDAVIAAPTPLASAVASGVLAIGDSVGSVVGLQLNGSSYDTYIQSRNMGAGSTAYNLLLQPLGGNVGIGTSSPAAKLELGSGTLLLPNNVFIQQKDSSGNAKNVAGVNSSNQYSFGGLDGSSTVNTIRALVAGNEAMRIDSSGNVGIGTSSPNAFGDRTFEVSAGANSAAYILLTTNSNTIKGEVALDTGTMYISTKTSNPIVFRTNDAERARIDSSGNLLVGTTATASYMDGRIIALSTSVNPALTVKSLDATQFCSSMWVAATTGNNIFANFLTETSPTIRGSITYNRAGGLVVYNTTSDYRAKTVNGLVQNALAKVALLEPSTGRMNGATEDIDFFVAHKLQEVVPSAVTGEKDAVNEDGAPKYQMVDKSALIPLLTAAIQEQQTLIVSLQDTLTALTARITALEQA